MQIHIPQNHKELSVFYILTNPDGEHFDAAVVKFPQLMNMIETDEVSYLTIVDKDTDPDKLFNRAIGYLGENDMANLQWKLRDKIANLNHGNGIRVECIDTGEIFSNAQQCARAHNLTYTQLLRHINGEKGHKSVKGKKYKKVE